MNERSRSGESTPFDAKEIDRLVDGELTALERNQLLRRFEDQPAGWRRCALAFIESQMWSADLKRMTTDGLLRNVERTAELAVAPPVTSRQGAFPTSVAWGWLAAAAAVMVAFSLDRRLDRSDTPPASVIPTSVADNSQSELGMALSAATERWLTESRVPIEVEQAIEELGAELKQEQGWVVRRRPNGQQYVVPYRDVHIVPVHAPAYK